MKASRTSSLSLERRDMPSMEEERTFLPPTVPLLELVVDGVPLSELLGVHRASLSFLASPMESSDVRVLSWFVNVLVGKEPASNQLDTRRAVLYGCHCGADYCGIVSCDIAVLEDEVAWRQIGYEDNGGMSDLYPVIDEIRFPREPYEQAVEQLFALRGVSRDSG